MAGGPAFPLTVTGTNFVGTSVVLVNGSPRATTVGSATALTATIPAGDIASGGTPTITVMTPAPGGGTSNGATLTVVGPTLTVSATTVLPNTAISVTLTNGTGNPTDWLGLAETGAPDTSYLQFVYVGAGTTRTWNFTVPATLGTYEVRLFANNGYTRLATSPAITVIGLSPQWTLAWSDEFNDLINSGVNASEWLYDTGTSYPGGPANLGHRRSRNDVESSTRQRVSGRRRASCHQPAAHWNVSVHRLDIGADRNSEDVCCSSQR